MRKRALLVLLAACVSLGAGEPESPPLTLDFLFAAMSGTPGVVADFHERKFLRLLDGPIESEGTLYFQPPDRWARVTSAPAKTRLVLDAGRMRFSDEAGSSDVALAESPIARVFAENMIAIFRGDRAELEARYRLEFHAEGERWQLSLTPKGAPLDRVIATIKLSGAGRTLRELIVVEIDGDSTQTVFDKSDPEHVFTADESLAAFGPRTAP